MKAVHCQVARKRDRRLVALRSLPVDRRRRNRIGAGAGAAPL